MYPAKTSSKTIAIAKPVTTPTTTTTVAVTTTTTVVPTCATGGVCVVGDTGPGGGIVFYVASGTFTQTGAVGSMCTTACKYLEAAPTNWLSGTSGDPTREWSTGVNQSSLVTGADAEGIGSGYQNSRDIAAQSGNVSASSAAVLALSNATGGKSDWFLPSKDELRELCKYARTQTTGNTSVACTDGGTLRAGFGPDVYWSSSEFDANYPWLQDLMVGFQGHFNQKPDTFYVRPVRAF